jgi:hypothetical protein
LPHELMQFCVVDHCFVLPAILALKISPIPPRPAIPGQNSNFTAPMALVPAA